MFSTELIVKFAKANASAYDDGGYMTNAFDKGAADSAPLARILAAVTDELWARGYSNEDLAKIYGANKMRIYQQLWEGVSPEQFNKDYLERVKLREELKARFYTR